MKKIFKTAIYLIISILNIILITYFLRNSLQAYEDGLLYGFQYYMRIVCGILIYLYILVFIFLLISEYTKRSTHSIWWEALSLIILFAAVMTNFF
ncbi:MAG: hypothetical protein N3B13_00045 [Deltaproteobacteria bacterium]|nr:hypothetical protein [Deltaproteobacteria bacterium]